MSRSPKSPMKTRSKKKHPLVKEENPLSTSARLVEVPADTSQNKGKMKVPCTENGTRSELTGNSDQPREPISGIQDLTKLMMSFFKTQEETLKLLSDIQTLLRHVIEQNAADHTATSSQLQQLSQQTTNIEQKLMSVNFTDIQKTVSPETSPENAALVISNKVIEERNQKLSEILLQEKRQKKTQEQSIRVKRTISLQWTQSMNQRKKSYSNFVKNYRKAQLYKDWIESSPDFLPLKYKPKRIPGEIPSYTTAKNRRSKAEIHQ